MRRPRVVIEPPTDVDRDEFFRRAKASTSLHATWITAPVDEAGWSVLMGKVESEANDVFLIRDARTGEMAGVIALNEIVRGVLQSAYLGYYAFASMAGRGYMSEGMRAVMRHAFGPMKLHRLEANIQPGNTRSIELVRRLGFEREGYSKRYLKIAGRWRDHERWAIVREQWSSSSASRRP